MKKSKKGNSRKFNSTFLLAGIVIILIAILAILLGFNYLNKSNDTNHDRIVEQSKNKNKNQDEVSKSDKKPKLIDNTTLQKTIDSASSIDRAIFLCVI